MTLISVQPQIIGWLHRFHLTFQALRRRLMQHESSELSRCCKTNVARSAGIIFKLKNKNTMRDEGYYWVKIAHFMNWSIGYFNGKFWKIIDDDNEYHNIDFNVIRPERILEPDEVAR